MSEAEREHVSLDVATALEDLEDQDTITAEDLERFRQQLPTDPGRARLVQLWLPLPWSEVFEYVAGSDRQAAYWRTKPDRRRSSPERETFGAAAERTTGVTGTVERDGREIPLSAAITADAMAGRRFSRARAAAAGRKALQRLRSLLDV